MLVHERDGRRRRPPRRPAMRAMFGRRQRRPGERRRRSHRELRRRPRPRRTACADGARDLRREPLVRAPTTSSVTGWPAWIAVAEALRDDERDVGSPASTAARAASSVGASDTSATPAARSDPMTSSRRTVASVAAVEVRDDPLRVERVVEPEELAEDHARARAARRPR